MVHGILGLFSRLMHSALRGHLEDCPIFNRATESTGNQARFPFEVFEWSTMSQMCTISKYTDITCIESRRKGCSSTTLALRCLLPRRTPRCPNFFRVSRSKQITSIRLRFMVNLRFFGSSVKRYRKTKQLRWPSKGASAYVILPTGSFTSLLMISSNRIAVGGLCGVKNRQMLNTARPCSRHC